ncbi:MAG: hypothetical protein Q4C96_07975 [Planctomycetia bacterium]|nr:hypothetical protein [Planctomycetia bacterium]
MKKYIHLGSGVLMLMAFCISIFFADILFAPPHIGGGARPGAGARPSIAKPQIHPSVNPRSAKPNFNPQKFNTQSLNKHFDQNPLTGSKIHPKADKPNFNFGTQYKPEVPISSHHRVMPQEKTPADGRKPEKVRPSQTPAITPGKPIRVPGKQEKLSPGDKKIGPGGNLSRFMEKNKKTPGWDPKDGFSPSVPRPKWQDMAPKEIDHFRQKWHNAVTKHSWKEPDFHKYDAWGDKYREHWKNKYDPGHHPPKPGPHPPKPGPVGPPPFTPGWWEHHHFVGPWWSYHFAWNDHPWRYWWTVPVWNSVRIWFSPWGWQAPYYYVYGDGGNVIYAQGDVYVNGQNVGSEAEYAQSAAELATVDIPDDLEDAPQQDSSWMPLGVFALLEEKDAQETDYAIQLAVNQEGVLSGTFFNQKTNKNFPIQGRVDSETQRVAFIIQGADDTVFETGIYNLVQKQTSILVHLDKNETKTAYLVRLEAPEDESGAATSVLQ